MAECMDWADMQMHLNPLRLLSDKDAMQCNVSSPQKILLCHSTSCHQQQYCCMYGIHTCHVLFAYPLQVEGLWFTLTHDPSIPWFTLTMIPQFTLTMTLKLLKPIFLSQLFYVVFTWCEEVQHIVLHVLKRKSGALNLVDEFPISKP